LADTRTIIEEWQSLTATLNSKGIKFNPQLKLGIRLRLHPTGGGKWIKSGGEAARFGLKTYEIIDAVEMLEKAKLLSKIEVLHFHLGSQIPGLEGIVNTIKEGMIVARDLKSIGLPIRIIDLGGGLPVDYDATRSSSEYSASYDYGDYANAVVSTLVEMCNKFDISHMDILSESGRFVTAHHAFLVTNIRSVMRAVYGDIPSRNVIPPSLPPPIHKKVTMLFDLFETLQKMKPMDSYLDIYQEAHRLRESLIRDFREGKITFRLMATIDRLFFYMIKEVMDLAMRDYERIDLSFKHIVSRIEEFTSLIPLAPERYLANFSLFTSAIDVWGVNQIFPIAPIARLNEQPTKTVFIEDITCDSDGEISVFQWQRYGLNLHDLNNKPYYIAIMLIGAYQEALSTKHNLLGEPNAITVKITPTGEYDISIRRGENISQVFRYAETDENEIKNGILQLIEEKKVDREYASAFLDYFKQYLDATTYLEGD
ncbi:MAG: biosynthetic arginine decarboxylase, partial [Candidatus Korarchaeota archaeon]